VGNVVRQLVDAGASGLGISGGAFTFLLFLTLAFLFAAGVGITRRFNDVVVLLGAPDFTVESERDRA